MQNQPRRNHMVRLRLIGENETRQPASSAAVGRWSRGCACCARMVRGNGVVSCKLCRYWSDRTIIPPRYVWEWSRWTVQLPDGHALLAVLAASVEVACPPFITIEVKRPACSPRRTNRNEDRADGVPSVFTPPTDLTGPIGTIRGW